MKSLIYFFLMCCFMSFQLKAQIKLKYQDNQTFTYEETIEAYKALAKKYPKGRLFEIGPSDVGKPIYLFVISTDGDFDANSLHKKGKLVLLVNNAIHPGEPCGVDASVKLAQDLLQDSKKAALLKNTVVCIIPFYNVGGGVNRNCCSRAGQNGPLEYGFRGNNQNRDLNRDFIKSDTRNTRAFTDIYHLWKPDIFVDTHTTNGSDYQYVLTLIATQADKLQPDLAKHLKEEMLPFLYKDMAQKQKEMVPYVYSMGDNPETGIIDFLETPRFSTGYTTLFNSIGFVTEALKYKPYAERVEHTYAFLESVLEWMHKSPKEIKTARQKAIEAVQKQELFDLSWRLDTSFSTPIDFKGYELEYLPSEFGENGKLLNYRQEQPYTRPIKYYNKYVPTVTVKKPSAYIIPQAYEEVVDRLKRNKIALKPLERDTIIAVEMYYIDSYETVKTPYEGHYLHYNVQVRMQYMPIQFYKGDYVVETNQSGNRYIVETLEPQGVDSYFAWNFFDGILQQKEWFSPFSFEPLAKKMLAEDASLKASFEAKKKEDPAFAKDHYGQLYYLYTQSPYYEKTHNRYPVGRVP